MSTLTEKGQWKKIIYFTLVVSTTLIGSMIYLGFASLYHLVLVCLLVLWMAKGVRFAEYNTTLVKFSFLWLAWALVSCVWAPDRALAIQYVYYIFLITTMCLLFHWLVNRDNLQVVLRMLTILLLACNLIAIWEIITGNHLVKDYLDSPIRLRLLEFVPGGFYRNPNDFATYIIQLMPFNFAALYDKRVLPRTIAGANLILSFFTVCATQSRTQVIVMLVMIAFFIVFSKKFSLVRIVVVAVVAVWVVSLFYTDLQMMLKNAWESIAMDEIQQSAESGGSLNTRFHALGNGLYMLRDYLGVGVGAGCHRALMPEYSGQYYGTGKIVVMHNFLGEMFVDYGIVVGFFFLYTIVRLCKRLWKMQKRVTEERWRVLAVMLLFTMATFVISGLSSSSLIQLTSIWTTFCLTDTIANLRFATDREEVKTTKRTHTVRSIKRKG